MDVFAELDDGSDRAPAAPRVRAVPQRRVAVLCGRGEHEPWVRAVFSHLAWGERKGHGPEREEEGRVKSGVIERVTCEIHPRFLKYRCMLSLINLPKIILCYH